MTKLKLERNDRFFRYGELIFYTTQSESIEPLSPSPFDTYDADKFYDLCAEYSFAYTLFNLIGSFCGHMQFRIDDFPDVYRSCSPDSFSVKFFPENPKELKAHISFSLPTGYGDKPCQVLCVTDTNSAMQFINLFGGH